MKENRSPRLNWLPGTSNSNIFRCWSCVRKQKKLTTILRKERIVPRWFLVCFLSAITSFFHYLAQRQLISCILHEVSGYPSVPGWPGGFLSIFIIWRLRTKIVPLALRQGTQRSSVQWHPALPGDQHLLWQLQCSLHQTCRTFYRGNFCLRLIISQISVNIWLWYWFHFYSRVS